MVPGQAQRSACSEGDGSVNREDWSERVERHREALRRRGGTPFNVAVSAETIPPTGSAGLWYDDVAYQMPPSARIVARQIARLCRADTQVTVPWRSLADAVGVADSVGREMAYTQRGVEVLEIAGWLRRDSTGRGRGAKTTFYLMPGDATFVGRRLKDVEEVTASAA